MKNITTKESPKTYEKRRDCLSPAAIGAVAKVYDGNIDTTRMSVKRENYSDLLYSDPEKSFPWLVQALKINGHCLSVKLHESSFDCFDYRDIRKAMFSKKLIGLV